MENPSFLFSEVGKKDVTLTIASLNGCMSTITKTIDVVLQAQADFGVSDICEGDAAVFTNKSKVAAGDLTYEWFFGDANTSTHVSPTHVYATTGTTRIVNVTLRAIVAGGCNAEVTKPLTINAAPDATFGVQKDGRHLVLDGPSGMTIYQWRFGDGASSTVEDPVYDYQNVDKGTFEICLTVKNDLCWNENCEEVTVDLSSIGDLTQDNSMLNVYPNPSAGVFTVEVSDAGEDVSIAVVDVLGNVLQVNVEDNLNGSYVIDMSGVSDGVYFVQVKNGDYYATKRVTISH
jgi:PKD repeat protein